MTRRGFLRSSAGATASAALAQRRPYDLVIKNGELRDPSQSLRRRADIGVLDGKIAAIEDSIPPERAFIGERHDLLRVEVAGVHEHRPVLVNGRHAERSGEREVAQADDLRQGKPAEVAGGRGLLGVEVAVGVEPDDRRVEALAL